MVAFSHHDVASMSITRNIAIPLLRWIASDAIPLLRWIASDEIETAKHRQRNASRSPVRWKML